MGNCKRNTLATMNRQFLTRSIFLIFTVFIILLIYFLVFYEYCEADAQYPHPSLGEPNPLWDGVTCGFTTDVICPVYFGPIETSDVGSITSDKPIETSDVGSITSDKPIETSDAPC